MSQPEIGVHNLDHLGIVAGIVDQLGVVEYINDKLGIHPNEKISAGITVKAMILNGLGFVSSPLYMFERFFVGIPTEHLLGEGVKPGYLEYAQKASPEKEEEIKLEEFVNTQIWKSPSPQPSLQPPTHQQTQAPKPHRRPKNLHSHQLTLQFLI